jgi:hypothetical protein
MKTVKYIVNAIGFLKSFNTSEKTENTTDLKVTTAKLNINLKKAAAHKAPTSLLSLLYSEENDILFI